MCDTPNLSFATSAHRAHSAVWDGCICTISNAHCAVCAMGVPALLAMACEPQSTKAGSIDAAPGMPAWYATIQQEPFPDSASELSQPDVIAQKQCLTKGSCTRPVHPKRVETGMKVCTECAVLYTISARTCVCRATISSWKLSTSRRLQPIKTCRYAQHHLTYLVAHSICYTVLSSNHLNAEQYTAPCNQFTFSVLLQLSGESADNSC